MKKLFLLLAFMAFALIGQAQTNGQPLYTYYYAALGNTFVGSHIVPCKIYLASLKTNLILTKSYPAGVTLAKAVSDGFLYYESPYTTTVTATTSVTTPYLIVHENAGTANIALLYNNKITAGDSAIVINKLGYLGLGKSTASARLDVNGNALVSGTVGVTGISTLGGAYIGGTLIRTSIPAAFDSTGTIPVAKMLRGVIKCTNTAAVTMTTPTATSLIGAITGGGQGTWFTLIIDNQQSTISGQVTLSLDGSIAVGSGVITGGNTLTVAISQCGEFLFYFPSGTTGRCYRIF